MNRRSLLLMLLGTLVCVSCVTSFKPEPTPVALIPKPVEMSVSDGIYYIDNKSTISVDDTTINSVAQNMAERMSRSNGMAISVSDKKGDIKLSTTLVDENPEAYELLVDNNGIFINGASDKGVINGISTLLQLLPAEMGRSAAIKYVKIYDKPYFPWRGMMLDVSRHFYTVDQVKDQLDLMARYKMNKFHWHLTDDQGWRVEIKKYPLLTEKGAWRKFNNQDTLCFKHEAEQGNPDFKLPTELMKVTGQDTLYGGFYTQDELRDVVAYASKLGIDVIPELDMPGHFSAAMVAYPELSCAGKIAWGEHFSSPICPGKDEVLAFCKDIYSEVADIFPYKYMHIGGDEVDKVHWKGCDNCQKRIKNENLKDENELQAWFIHRMEEHFNSLGKDLMGWDEILDGGLSPTATITWWRNWAPDAVGRTTAQGNKAVMSPCFTLYFDGWENNAGNIEAVYNYNPLTPHITEEAARNVYKIDPAYITLSPEQQKLVMGIQANLWCETIPSVARMQYQAMPRMIALGEITWCDPSKKDWNDFNSRYVEEINYLDNKGIRYFIPMTVANSDSTEFDNETTFAVSSPLPKVTIRYTTDGSLPMSTSAIYDRPVKIDTSCIVTYRAYRPDGSFGSPMKIEYKKK